MSSAAAKHGWFKRSVESTRPAQVLDLGTRDARGFPRTWYSLQLLCHNFRHTFAAQEIGTLRSLERLPSACTFRMAHAKPLENLESARCCTSPIFLCLSLFLPWLGREWVAWT